MFLYGIDVNIQTIRASRSGVAISIQNEFITINKTIFYCFISKRIMFSIDSTQSN